MDISVSKDFAVNSKSLKDVRDFAREIFDQSPVFSQQKDELVLAIAEAAQNIVKHAYKDITDTKDVMQIKISFKDNIQDSDLQSYILFIISNISL